MASRHRPSVNARGFTLLEMLVALVIVAGAMAGVMFSVRPMRQQRIIVSAAASLASLAERAHSKALRDGVPTILSFDLEDRTVTLSGTHERLRFDGGLSLSVETAREFSTRNEQTIVFLPDGSATGGSVTITMPGTQLRRLLRISWMTGAGTEKN